MNQFAIDPTLPEHLDKPLWVVYGPDCFPTVFCCKILHHHEFGLIIWGYSVYKREPGFRTLGTQLATWRKENSRAKFFCVQHDAMNHLTAITRPKCE